MALEMEMLFGCLVDHHFGLKVIKFCTNIHHPQRINPTDYSDFMSLHVAPLDLQFHFSSEISTRWTGTDFGTDIHSPLSMNTLVIPSIVLCCHNEINIVVFFCEMSWQ